MAGHPAHQWGAFVDLDSPPTGGFVSVIRASCDGCGAELLVLKQRGSDSWRPVYVPPCGSV